MHHCSVCHCQTKPFLTGYIISLRMNEVLWFWSCAWGACLTYRTKLKQYHKQKRDKSSPCHGHAAGTVTAGSSRRSRRPVCIQEHKEDTAPRSEGLGPYRLTFQTFLDHALGRGSFGYHFLCSLSVSPVSHSRFCSSPVLVLFFFDNPLCHVCCVQFCVPLSHYSDFVQLCSPVFRISLITYYCRVSLWSLLCRPSSCVFLPRVSSDCFAPALRCVSQQ